MAHPLTTFLATADYSNIEKLAKDLMNFAQINQVQAQQVHFPLHLHHDRPIVVKERDYYNIVVNRAEGGNKDIVSLYVVENQGFGKQVAHFFNLVSGIDIQPFKDVYRTADAPFIPAETEFLGILQSFSTSGFYRLKCNYETLTRQYNDTREGRHWHVGVNFDPITELGDWLRNTRDYTILNTGRRGHWTIARATDAKRATAIVLTEPVDDGKGTRMLTVTTHGLKHRDSEIVHEEFMDILDKLETKYVESIVEEIDKGARAIKALKDEVERRRIERNNELNAAYEEKERKEKESSLWYRLTKWWPRVK